MESKKGFSKYFWMVVVGQIISLFGNAIMRFALPVHLLDVTGSAALLGIVSGCAFIPLVVMSPVGGIIADRVNKRNIMVCLDFFTAGVTVLFLALYGKVSLVGLIMVMLFLLYGIGGAYQPAVQASIPLLTAEDKVMPANAVINMVSSLAGLLGPALGGITYSLWGIRPLLAASACCFLASAVLEIFIKIPYSGSGRERKLSAAGEFKEDLRSSLFYIIRENPAVGKLTICCAGVNLVLSSSLVIGLPVVVMQVLQFPGKEGSSMYGFMQGAFAIGGLAGGIGAGVFSRKLTVQKSFKLLACAGMLVLPMGLSLMAGCTAYAAYAVLVVSGMLIMAMASIYTIQVMSYIQVAVPANMTGKVIAWVIAASTCAQPAGQIIYGALFEQMKEGISYIFYLTAVVTVAVAYYSRRVTKELKGSSPAAAAGTGGVPA